MATHSLNEYRRKRDFRRSPEPVATTTPAGAVPALGGHLYVMHKHAARRLHFDLRMEQAGVLRSWALPRGAPLEHGDKRLAIEVEDHPLEYGTFEGTIPKNEYGGGTVMLWDVGMWQQSGRNDDQQIDFTLTGTKLRGAWTLVRMHHWDVHGKQKQWLLIKRSDHPQHELHPDDLSVMSGRSMEEIAAGQEAHATEQRPAPPVASRLSGVRLAPVPAALPPQLAASVERAPTGDAWLHEIKFDGYRIVAYVASGKVRLMTRNGLDWTSRLRALARRLAMLPVQDAILDGELVALSASGSSSFRDLQETLSRKQTAQLTYQVFDLVHLDGHDLSSVPLLERKQAVAQLLNAAGFEPGSAVRYSDHVRGQGPEFFEQACSLGLEGIVSKRADAPYRSGRSTLWQKVKCAHQNAEFVVGGYTPPAGARSGFGALLLGTYRRDGNDGKLEYSGRLGTGFSSRQLESLHAQLQREEIAHSPFVPSESLPRLRGVHWVQPRIVVAVEYVERTRDGLLRQPTFLGVREDVAPDEIEWSAANLEEAPASATRAVRPATSGAVMIAGSELTHPERILYPELGVTKLALARYHETVHEWLLPYLAHRPLVLLRCPDGHREERKTCFYQKHLPRTQAGSVPRVSIREEDGTGEYVHVRSLADILALVQHDVLELHAWGCRVEDVEHPDLIVFDLDPAPDVAWAEVLRTACVLRERLGQLGLTAFPRTTGGKGLHLVVPLKPKADWHVVKEFSRTVVELHAKDEPRLFTTNPSLAKRRGRIFLDYLRNARGATAIASYSPRARPRAPVAVPLRWEELSPAVRSDHYTVETLPRRLAALKADPWEGFFEAAVPLDAKRLKAVGVHMPSPPASGKELSRGGV
ncbi:MAG TPA: DNA ligase D [Gallionella sp.]